MNEADINRRITELESQISKMRQDMSALSNQTGGSSQQSTLSPISAFPNALRKILNWGFEWVGHKVNVKGATSGAITVSSSGVAVQVKANNGLAIDTFGLYPVIKVNAGLAVNSSGFQTVLKSAGGVLVDANGLYIDWTLSPVSGYPGAGVANSTGSAWGTSYTVGTAANNLVQLNASSQLPAVSAALLTNFPTFNQNTTGSSGSCTGNAASSSTLANVDDHATNAVMFPLWTATQGGNYAAKTSNNLTYNPSTGLLTSTELKLSSMLLGTPTYTTVDNWFNTVQSSGRISGFTISAHSPADGTVDVSAGTGIVKVANTVGAVTKFFDFAGVSGVVLTDNILNFLYVDYNSGSPQILVTTDRTTVNSYSQFIIGRVYREGTDASEITNSGVWIDNGYRRIHDRTILKYGIDHISGAVVSEAGTRGLQTTAGVWYIGESQYTTIAKTTPTYGIDVYYRSATPGVWNRTQDVTQLGNTQYDNGTGTLATLQNINSYGIYWVYLCTQGDMYAVYGHADYTLATAQAAQPPSTLPDYIVSNTRLAAKVIFKKSDTHFTEVDSAWSTVFSSGTPVNHNELGGLQGGTSNEYYHLTSAEYTNKVLNQPTLSNARVSAQFDKTNATLANITGLSVNLAAGLTYAFRIILFVNVDVAGGSKYALAGTATATSIVWQINGTSNADFAFVLSNRQTSLGGSGVGKVGTPEDYTEITGLITVANAGTLVPQFAQNTASGTSSVLVGSHMIVQTIA